MSDTIQKDMIVPQPRERVWRAITDRAALADWLFPNDFLPVLGHRFTFQVPPNPKMNFDGLTVHSEVLECDPPSRLAFSWSAGPLVDTRVSFRLETVGEGTRLFFEHSGFDLTQPGIKPARFGAEYGWTKMLGELPAVAARLKMEES
jgi:uncharacterized protein YndB with AHSA1/START domain